MSADLNQFILENRPSVIRNSFLVYFIWFAFWLLTFLFAITGIACVVGGDVQKMLVLDPMVQVDIISQEISNQLYDKTKLLGIILLILGVLCSLVIWLCRKLIERNLFIMELERWRERVEGD